MVTRVLAVLVTCLLASVAQAQDIVLSIQDEDFVVGEFVPVQVVVRGASPREVPEITADPALAIAFETQAATTTSINGRVSRFVNFKFKVRAREAGTFQLGPATVLVDVPTGQTIPLTSNVVTVHAGAAPADDDRPLAVTTTISPDVAWLGEVVMYDRTLRSKVELKGGRWFNDPSDGLMAPREGNPERREYVARTDDGSVLVQEIHAPMIATRTGVLTFDAPALEADVVVKTDRRGFFFGVPTERRVVPGQDMTLEVRPLPPAPPGFSGLVGHFEIDSRVDDAVTPGAYRGLLETQVGASVDWRVALVGQGDLAGFRLPMPDTTDGVQIYEGDVRSNAIVRQGNYRASAAYIRTVVPIQEGVVSLPDIDLVVFDPTIGQYVTLHEDGPQLRVAPGEVGDVEVQSFRPEPGIFSGPAPEAETHGIRPLRAGAGSRLPWGATMPVAWAVTGLPAIVWLLLELATRVRTRRREDAPVREATPRERLARLPDDPEARLAAQDAALRLAVARAVDPDLDREATLAALPPDVAAQVHDVTAWLDRVRFAGATPPADLDARVAAAVDALEAA